MRPIRLAPWLALAVLAGFSAYVRLAPVEPGRWHIGLEGLAAELSALPPRQVQTGARHGAVRIHGGKDLLARLDTIALATPRTQRIAGAPESGHVTWQTRSLFFGFPDYTTAEVIDSDLILLARSRFGRSDWGVNAARLRDWLAKL